MLRNVRKARSSRRGATAVETALVLMIFMMFVFGIFEWARYLFMFQLTQNAARDGARFAAVRVNQSDLVTVTSTDTTTFPGRTCFEIQGFTDAVTARMGGMHTTLNNFKVRVYPCDPVGMYAETVVVQPKPEVSGVTSTWNNAVFSERIAIQVDGQYRVILPTMFFLPDTINIRCISLVSSEG
jgi:Flp pilus assembly protein TadG